MNGSETRAQHGYRMDHLRRQTEAMESRARAEHAKVGELKRLADLVESLVKRVEKLEADRGS